MYLSIIKALADQALEEGRHKDALGLYRATLATTTTTTTTSPLTSVSWRADNGCSSHRHHDDKRVIARAAGAAQNKKEKGKTEKHKAENEKERYQDEEQQQENEKAGEEDADVIGDALHGVGVALLAAGRFREACQAWER